MNSRNHIMFGSIGSWMYDWLAGLRPVSVFDAGKSSSGSQNVIVIQPPPPGVIVNSEVRLARATRTVTGNNRAPIASEWERTGGRICASAPEDHNVVVDCGRGNVIEKILFASFGLPFGPCGGTAKNATCHASTSTSVVSQSCVGQRRCKVLASDANFGDPCFGHWKRMTIEAQCSRPPHLVVRTRIPPNFRATVAVSEMNLIKKSLVIREAGKEVWRDGKFIPGAYGVTSGRQDGAGNVVFDVESGAYEFATDNEHVGTHICATVKERETLRLSCPQGTTIALVDFASFGTPTGTCNDGFAASTCDAGSSVHVIERTCLRTTSCEVRAEDWYFGDPCFGTAKTLSVMATCA
jgi:Galactose binding lectin domain